jgi:hypothetical protein
VAGRELSDFIDALEKQGYLEKTLRHQLPGVVERNKVVCE